VGENLTRRVRENMFSAVFRDEMAWFDADENGSARVAAHLALDAQNVRSAIGDRISVIVQNSTLLLVACTAGLVLQWRLALLLLAVFPLVVAATVLQKMFIKGFSGDLEAAHARTTQIATATTTIVVTHRLCTTRTPSPSSMTARWWSRDRTPTNSNTTQTDPTPKCCSSSDSRQDHPPPHLPNFYSTF
jgi:hypothetical protein